MRDKIFLINQNKELQALEMQSYDSEALLQRLLSDYPDLLAGYQMNETNPRRWLLVAREMGIADDLGAGERWSLDHLFLDQDGTPTLVEVKRATDTRIRREVAGQMLDYAANAILHWSPEIVRQRFDKRCTEQGLDPAEVVAIFLEVASTDSEKIDSFWETVFNRLKTGQIRLVFVADEIPKELRRIIEFLNEHMRDVEVLGVEMPQYVGSGLTTIVPKVIGKTTIAEQAKASRSGRHWDEGSFFQELQQRFGDVPVRVARRILDWANEKQLRVWWGKGNKDGEFVPVLDYGSQSQQLFGIWTDGKIEFQFQWYQRPPFNSPANRIKLMSMLNQIGGVNLVEQQVTKRPSIPLTLFANETSMSQLLESYNWFIDELYRAV